MEVAYIGIKGLPSKGGAERVVEAIVKRMPAHGINTTVYCDLRYTPVDYSLDGIKLVRLPSIQNKYLRMIILGLLAALHAVAFGNYDLIHLHHREASFVLPILRLRYRIISTSHGAAYWRTKWGSLAKYLIRLMDFPFITLSNAATSVSLDDSKELDQKFDRRVIYIPNGVDLSITPDQEQAHLILKQHDLEPGKYLIFVAGRIVPTKGAHLAIDAVNQMPSNTPLLIVGDDDHVPQYSQSLRQMAGPRVKFQPLVENPDILFGLMADAHCLVFPSLVEAMSMVLLEAASINVPIVCSDIPENREILHDEAVYFQSDNVQDLIDQLEWAINHPNETSQLSHRAQDSVNSEFSWDSIASRYADLYQEVINTP